MLVLSAVSFAAFAQQYGRSVPDSALHKTGTVRIIADTQMVHDIKPAVVTEDEPQMNGYRIQVYGGTEREAAQKLKNEIAISYGIRTYMIYESPYFKVRVGDFRSRMEAQQMLHSLKKNYTSILLVPGSINLPALK